MAGQSYEVNGVSNSDNYTWGDPGFATDPSISIIPLSDGNPDRWESIGTPDFLTDANSGNEFETDGFWGPNLFFGAPIFTGTVPEPSSLPMLLAGLGLIGGAFYLGRRKVKAS
jgi:PEP-CTERM motif